MPLNIMSNRESDKTRVAKCCTVYMLLHSIMGFPCYLLERIPHKVSYSHSSQALLGQWALVYKAIRLRFAAAELLVARLEKTE